MIARWTPTGVGARARRQSVGMVVQESQGYGLTPAGLGSPSVTTSAGPRLIAVDPGWRQSAAAGSAGSHGVAWSYHGGLSRSDGSHGDVGSHHGDSSWDSSSMASWAVPLVGVAVGQGWLGSTADGYTVSAYGGGGSRIHGVGGQHYASGSHVNSESHGVG
jgi:hypothetical protein